MSFNILVLSTPIVPQIAISKTHVDTKRRDEMSSIILIKPISQDWEVFCSSCIVDFKRKTNAFVSKMDRNACFDGVDHFVCDKRIIDP